MLLRKQVKALAIFVVLGFSAAAAHRLTPTVKIADTRPKTSLDFLIPKQLGDWKVDTTTPVVLPAADVQARLDKIYNQVVARTYVNKAGYRIMLSVAYGGDQSDGLSVHRPEVCYPAQGFEVSNSQTTYLQLQDTTIPVTRLLTKLGSRREPVTYWIVNGDKAVGQRFEARLAQLQYGLKGYVPDGMLVRISSVDDDPIRAFGIQSDFANALVSNVDSTTKPRFGVGGA